MTAVRSRFFPSLILCGLLILLAMPPVAATTGEHRFQGVERVVAFGDVHGAYRELVSLLTGLELVDEDLAWTGGRTHLVSMGDLIDRGDYGRKVMDLLMRLQQEAREAGGAVHVVLGNHEVMVMTGDLRYVSPGDFAAYGDTGLGELPPGSAELIEAFAPDGRYGRWLLSLPFAVQVNDTVFVHGGLSRRLAGKDLAAINREGQQDLRRFIEGRHRLIAAGELAPEDDFATIQSKIAALAGRRNHRHADTARDMARALDGIPFHPEGVLWYRGSALCHPYMETDNLRAVLEGLGAQRLVVGHTPTADGRIASRLDGRVLRIDNGMNKAFYGGRPAALVLEGGQARAFYPGDGWMAIEAEPNRLWARPFDMDDGAIEDFLLTAEVTGSKDLSEGVTRSVRLDLEKDGRKMRALFKTVDTHPNLPRVRWDRTAERSDRWAYEVAAYQLDRFLGLEMTPVTVERTIDGETGALQYWIENAFNENRRREEQIPFTGHCDLREQFNLMNVFDVLIHNVDRNLGDILYDPDWTLWLIDHSMAFVPRRERPRIIRQTEISLNPELRAALARVRSDDLEFLRPYLHARQIRALEQRAEDLLRTR